MRVSDSPVVDARWALPGLLAGAAQNGATRRVPRRTARDWAIDSIAFLVSLCFVALTAVVQAPDPSTGEMSFGFDGPREFPLVDGVLDPVLGVLLCLSLWWRRRFPLALSLVALVLSTFTLSTGAATVILLFTLAVHRPWPVSVPVNLLQIPVSFLHLRITQGSGGDWGSLIFGALIGMMVLAWGIAVRARRQLVLSLRESAEQERSQQELRLVDARRGERSSIAREMHDVLAHRISLLSVHAGALEYRTRQAESGNAAPLTATEVHDAVTVIRENAHQALEELREVLTVLRTDTSDDQDDETGTAAPQAAVGDLAALVEEARAAGQQIHVTADAPGLDEARPQLQRTVFRVVQEGLTNARKHAPEVPVNVLLRGTAGDEVVVEVTNVTQISTPRSTIPGAGAGLTGLTERVLLEGGTLEAGASGGAFRLKVRLPWRS